MQLRSCSSSEALCHQALLALEFVRELGQNSWAPPGITRGKGTATIYQRHTEVWHISSSTVPAIPTSAQFAFPNRSTRPLSNSGTRCLTVAQATFPAASGIEFGAHVYITAFANSNQTELTLLVTVYRILIIISYSEGLHRAVKCRRPWCRLPVNTWTQKANSVAMLQSHQIHAFLYGKSPSRSWFLLTSQFILTQ